jgi:hypothetical protein
MQGKISSARLRRCAAGLPATDIKTTVSRLETLSAAPSSVLSLSKAHDGCAPAAGFGRRVRPTLDEGRAGKYFSYRLALHADALAMNDSDAAKSGALRLAQILFDDAPDVARRDGVQVKNVSNLQTDGFGEGIEEINLVLFFVVRKPSR